MYAVVISFLYLKLLHIFDSYRIKSGFMEFELLGFHLHIFSFVILNVFDTSGIERKIIDRNY